MEGTSILTPPFLRSTKRHFELQAKHQADEKTRSVGSFAFEKQNASENSSTMMRRSTDRNVLLKVPRNQGVRGDHYYGGNDKCTDGFLSAFGCENGASLMLCTSKHTVAPAAFHPKHLGHCRDEKKEESEPEFHTISSSTAAKASWWFSLTGASNFPQTSKPPDKKTVVKFSDTSQAFNPPNPLSPEEKALYFWSNAEGNELKEQRRAALLDFKFNYVQRGEALSWDDNRDDSIRGLEDHTAELLGEKNSYFIRRAHMECVLKEHHIQKQMCCSDEVRLQKVSLKSSVTSQNRALERAAGDQEAIREGANTKNLDSSLQPVQYISPVVEKPGKNLDFALFVSYDSEEHKAPV